MFFDAIYESCNHYRMQLFFYYMEFFDLPNTFLIMSILIFAITSPAKITINPVHCIEDSFSERTILADSNAVMGTRSGIGATMLIG